MTPIGSTSSNIRRAIEFMVDPSYCNLGAPSGRSRSVGRLRTAKLMVDEDLRGWPFVTGVADPLAVVDLAVAAAVALTGGAALAVGDDVVDLALLGRNVTTRVV